MNAVSIDIKDMLEADPTLALVFADNLFVSKEPEKPRNTVTIFDVAGGATDSTLENKQYYHPSIQIRIRNSNYISGYTLADKIQKSLHGRAMETWGGSLYTVIKSVTDIFHLDYDSNDNARFIINFDLQRR